MELGAHILSPESANLHKMKNFINFETKITFDEQKIPFLHNLLLIYPDQILGKTQVLFNGFSRKIGFRRIFQGLPVKLLKTKPLYKPIGSLETVLI